MKPPLFILGCPRSGTTFLASLLKESSFGVPFETHFIIKHFKKLQYYNDLNQYENFSRLVKAILAERAIMQRKLEIDIFEMFSNMREKTYPGIINEICFRIASKSHKGVTSWGDKTPFYTLHIDILLKLFPESKMIYITRDGRDVALSLMERPWGSANVYACALLWKHYIEQKKELQGLIASRQAHEIKYEDILREPQQGILKLYEFLGEEYYPQKMQKHLVNIKKDNYNKWKKVMSENDRKLFENVAADTLKIEGYETKYQEQKMNPASVLYYKLHNQIKHITHLIKINTIDTIAITWFNKEPFNR